jgi:hypothetical protein
MAADDSFDRPSREPRPAFSADEPIAERLVRVVMNLAAELAVVHERLDTVERLLGEKGAVTAADIEAFLANDAVDAERREWRETYVRRIFADLEAEIAVAQRQVSDRDSN